LELYFFFKEKRKFFVGIISFTCIIVYIPVGETYQILDKMNRRESILNWPTVTFSKCIGDGISVDEVEEQG